MAWATCSPVRPNSQSMAMAERVLYTLMVLWLGRGNSRSPSGRSTRIRLFSGSKESTRYWAWGEENPHRGQDARPMWW